MQIDPREADNAGSRSFACERCGATLKYIPGTEVLRCDYCRHQNPITISATPVIETDFRRALAKLATEHASEEKITVRCESCGAKYSFDPEVHAGECPFCGAATVSATENHRQIAPTALLPFKISQEEARNSFHAWLRKLWFAPTQLTAYARSNAGITGLYVPYWTYDADTVSNYQGSRGNYYQVPESYESLENGRIVRRTRMVTKIRWTPVAGVVSRNFDDVLVLASHTLPRPITERLEPWDLDKLEAYRPEYLSGFRSEMYQIDLAQGFGYAQEIMGQVIRKDITNDIGGDLQRIHHFDTRYSNIFFKHILLPIWVSAFRFKDKSYRFVVNGRTGKVNGQRPLSPWKIAIAVLLAAILAGIAFMAWTAAHGNWGS
jgi:DNA-directed RNA polymerase subunit RPC12/RpoP